jgi:hypothetical protein
MVKFTKVISLIIDIANLKDTKWKAIPFKRKLGETDNKYDEDYFCYERDLKYLDILAATKEDVLELMYFLVKPFGLTKLVQRKNIKAPYRRK